MMTRHQASHPSNSELLMFVDGELSARDAARVEAHFAACWSCRSRKQAIEASIAEFIRMREAGLESALPSMDGPRALLKARLSALASHAERSNRWLGIPRRPEKWALALVVCCLGLLSGMVLAMRHGTDKKSPAVFVPNARLTPGATVLERREDVCAAAEPKNRMVSVSLRKQVLNEYGVGNAEPQAYEVDYLITPALGGADDIRNLWPQSYAADGWNAHVKDALEDRLHDMVCDGQLDLTTAQREISSDWIAAYKKYFHTDRPIETIRP
jgi:hypothetical protein